MPRNIYIFMLLTIVIGLLACGRSRISITAAGSTAFQPFAEKLADQYMVTHPNINITVQGGGSAVGIQSALSGAAAIGMADLVKLPAEASALQAVMVAQDGVVVVVHPANTATNLTMDQVRDIFSGKIKSWQELDGSNAAITVVSREAGSGTRISFEQIVGHLALTKDAIIQDSNGTIRETVANDANAIGYLSHGLLNERIKALTINGQSCTNEAIREGLYTLSRPIYLLTKGSPGQEVQEFIEFILSADGQKIIADSGLLPVK
jgi:phosphate transport system substrate-binding protein